jgi:hypothetical protein
VKEAVRPRRGRALRIVGLTALAVLLSLLSVHVERSGPEQAPYGNLCGATADQQCLEPVLKGGFPIAFLFDAPGVSVEHQLFVGEDHLRVDLLAANTALYLGAMLLLGHAVQRHRARGAAR